MATATKKKTASNKQNQPNKNSLAKSHHSDDELTVENYYQQDTDWRWQSPTWFKKFLACEAEALAELKGDYQPEQNITALLVGNYLHSYFESEEAHQKFIDDNKKEIIASSGKNNGKPKKEYEVADKMIDCLESDPAFNQLYQGDKEVIVTGELFGVDWKGKIDCLNLDRGYFIDLKTTADIHKKFWDNKERQWQSFVAAYNYQLQMWVYQQLIKQQFEVICQPYIIAVSKSNVPDKTIISIPDYRMEEAERTVEMRQNHIELVKTGQAKPRSCGLCDYCKLNKKLSEIISMDELIS
jgi:hypothetical protein